MEVILLGKMRNLGELGDQVKVKSGFARNYLIPQGKAVYATKENINKFEQRRTELEKLASEKLQHAMARQHSLHALPVITIIAKASEEGKLFGSITIRDIVEALKKAGAEVEKREMHLSQGSLRTLGEHDITIELESDVTATIKVNIIPES